MSIEFKKYVKKPERIKAVEFTHDLFDYLWENHIEIKSDYAVKSEIYYKDIYLHDHDTLDDRCAYIRTPEGDYRVRIGDYIIVDSKGDIHICTTQYFNLVYEEVEEYQ